ncbi:MAG: family 16 glycosylhydrolase [Pseudomonadota bacterium]
MATAFLLAAGAQPVLALDRAISDLPGFEDTFAEFDTSAWHPAHYRFSHPHFDTDWDASLVDAEKGLRLSLRPQSQPGANGFLGASIRRHAPSHFGRYEAELTAARGDGLITGFFLYTGAAYGTQHDEIDWEIFGKDPTTAQVAWWKDGTLRSQKIDLGFDAAAGPNRYAIDWQPDAIRWFVNGTLVFETTEAIPQTPQLLFANVWAVDKALADWAGTPQGGTRAEAKAYLLRHVPTGG